MHFMQIMILFLPYLLDSYFNIIDKKRAVARYILLKSINFLIEVVYRFLHLGFDLLLFRHFLSNHQAQ